MAIKGKVKKLLTTAAMSGALLTGVGGTQAVKAEEITNEQLYEMILDLKAELSQRDKYIASLEQQLEDEVNFNQSMAAQKSKAKSKGKKVASADNSFYSNTAPQEEYGPNNNRDEDVNVNIHRDTAAETRAKGESTRHVLEGTARLIEALGIRR